MTADPGCPYKGLASYEDSELDVRFFFGRERERDTICANLMASKLTVLYGDTGVGKSSVLGAGVAHSLRARGEALSVVVFDSWKDDPATGLAAALGESAGVEPRDTLADTLEACSAKLDGDVYVILDGVEEYFLYHEGETGPGTFFSELPDAIKRPGLRVSFLLAIREDALAKLDRFKAGIPNLFGNYLRLAHLDREAGKSAILGPVDRYNELVDASERITVDTDLADAVLDEVAAGRVDLGQTGRGVVAGTQGDDRIEAPYLQLVMRRLWEAEAEAGSRTLRKSTLVALGGAEEIVRAHLARALEPLTGQQKDVAAAVFNHLVTPSGTKIAHAGPDLARYAGVAEAELEPVLATLARERILRPAAADGGGPRFEIYHDVLGEAVLAWRAAHEAERELAAERKRAGARHRRLLRVIGAGGVLLAVMAGVTAYAVSQRSEARTQARQAQVRQLDSEAVSQLTIDPELSLVLAAEAARLVPSAETEAALRTSYIFSRERAMLPTRGPVSAASYSRDGLLIVVASEDGTARVVDSATRRPVLTVDHGGTPLLGAAFAPDGKRLITAGQDGTARVWDIGSGKRLSTLRHGSPVRTAALDSRGSKVVTSGGREVKIWRSDGTLIAAVPWDKPVTDAAFSPGDRLVLATGNDSVARVYDAATGKLARTFDQGGRVTSAAFGPGGGLVVTTGANETARIWRVRDGRLLQELKGHRGSVLDAAFNRGGTKVATASADGTGRIWSLRSGASLATVGGHRGIVDAVAFSPDGNFVVTGSADRTARVSKTDSGDGRANLAGHGDSVHAVAFSPDGRRVLTASGDGTARLWDPAIQPQLELVYRGRGQLAEAEHAPRGGRIVVAGPDSKALVLRNDGRLLDEVDAGGPVSAVAVSPDEKLIAIAGGGMLTLRSPDGSTVAFDHPGKVTSVAFSPDGKRMVTGGDGGKAIIWSKDGKRLVELVGHREAITDVAFSPDGNRVATSSRDKTARIWDAETGVVLRPLIGHKDDVTSVAFSPDGRLVLTASRDHNPRLWNAYTGARTQVLRLHSGEVKDATFSPDGRWILTAGPATVLLWQPGVQEPILPYGFGGHKLPISSAVFDPTSRYVLTAGADGTVRRAECAVCRNLDGMLELARAQLAVSRRPLTGEERERYGLD